MSRLTVKSVYDRLYDAYGPQHWWPGETPFEVMVGAVLTQNTAWTNVERAITNLKEAQALAPRPIVAAPAAQLADWIRPAGYFNVKARRLQSYCNWYLEQGEHAALQHMDTALLRDALLAVHGVGPETADDILLYACARPVFVIDAYTRRLLARLGLASGAESYETLRRYMENKLRLAAREEGARVVMFNEYHALIVRHAKEACRKTPVCAQCCLVGVCPSAVTASQGKGAKTQ